MNLNKDAFSSGQISSKLWLCEEVEKLFSHIDHVLILGGWYAITAFLLKSRNHIEIKKIVSMDIDPACELIADQINENWKWQNWQFKAYTYDCNKKIHDIKNYDLIINTSTEHFENLRWFKQIPKGKTVVLQGADMIHDDHIFEFRTLEDFIQTFPLKKVYFKGVKHFKYPDWEFKRFMLIGEK